MTHDIDAILFDMGGTLRRNFQLDEIRKQEYIQKMLDLLGSKSTTRDFQSLLEKRDEAYDAWATQNLTELTEAELWTKWLLPDWPADLVHKHAMELNHLWRAAIAKRVVYPETPYTVMSLYRRGYRLALVSNTTSSVDSPQTLEKEKIAGCFDTMVLSCVVGMRKPGADILLEATRRMGVEPERCVYIGDRPDWDVVAARKAGFKMAIILRNPNKPLPETLAEEHTPDFFIDNLKELLNLFPARNGKSAHLARGQVYDASFSTMWGMKKFTHLDDFFLASSRFGFAGVELNHQIRPAMLKGLDLKAYRITSIHEPCPAVIAAEELRKRDLLISSPDEECRSQGVDAIRLSIDMAHELGAHTVVIHSGQIQENTTLEDEMRVLYRRGLQQSSEFLEKRDRLAKAQAKYAPVYMDAVKRSLRELLLYAKPLSVRLGIENRLHPFDLPGIDGMQELLELESPEWIGFIYDVGHAQVQDQLGFTPHEDWLKRYGNRIIGTHLHDVLGINDHLAPGLGEVDFKMVARYLPVEAYRTVEVQSINSTEQVKTGISKLRDMGCIQLVP